MKDRKGRKPPRRGDEPGGTASIDATGTAVPKRSRRWRVSLVILAGGASIGIAAMVMSYSTRRGTITVLNATDAPLVQLHVESAGGSAEIARVEPHSSGIGVVSSGNFDGILRLRYALNDPVRPGAEVYNRILYKVPAGGLRTLTFSLSEPAKSQLFREYRLEVAGISNFSVSGIVDDLGHGRFPGRKTLGSSVSRSENPMMAPLPEPKP